MQLVLHAGAHFTEENRLMKCLLRNKDSLHNAGVAVPGPGRYRDLLRGVATADPNESFFPQARDALIEAMLDGETADRVLLSTAHIFGWPRAAVRQGMMYPQAADRLAQIAAVFRHEDIELFMAIRNPATFIPACFAKHPEEDILEFLGGWDPLDIRWSDTFEMIRSVAPDIPITVWCNEDAPLLWSQVIREISGLEHGTPIVGGFDLFEEIIAEDGRKRFRSYLENKPNLTEIQLRRVMAAFLEKFALDDVIEEEVDLQGWTTGLISEMSEQYEEDVALISRIPGVEVLTL